jgi:hypothetical protein
LDENSYATRFPVETPMNNEGHPEYEPLKKAVFRLFAEEIVSRKENV